MTIDYLAIDIVRGAINVRREVLIVIEMKGLFARLERSTNRELLSSRPDPRQTFVTLIARRQVSINRQQFVGIHCPPVIPCKLRL
jgi:hypothetical protein